MDTDTIYRYGLSSLFFGFVFVLIPTTFLSFLFYDTPLCGPLLVFWPAVVVIYCTFLILDKINDLKPDE
ncbi:hypothetical protein MsAc7_13200 [Methanolapillus millepedarum]|uniref:Uncharacterized protein n=1 Tax=Methanolapillus millepedarum TaxID=3028296 RepID=A0AA96ZUH6_9EURY|nr:hypothetical protein MsAc7_13200 [Methanosarcinaceae archaeon Ac7]